MKQLRPHRVLWLAGLSGLAIFSSGAVSPAWGQSMGEYRTVPPFASGLVPPNILILLDNLGSMSARASDQKTFSSTSAYSGIFHSASCYAYSNGKLTDPQPPRALSGMTGTALC